MSKFINSIEFTDGTLLWVPKTSSRNVAGADHAGMCLQVLTASQAAKLAAMTDRHPSACAALCAAVEGHKRNNCQAPREAEATRSGTSAPFAGVLTMIHITSSAVGCLLQNIYLLCLSVLSAEHIMVPVVQSDE